MSRITQDQLAELELLRERDGGRLDPASVVDFARSNNTALHRLFTWDDTAAAERWRLHQAGMAIRAAVTMLPAPDGAQVPVRAYVRSTEGRGYTATAQVMADPEAADVLLRQMRLDVERAVARYRRYESLAPHIAAALGALTQQVAE